MGRSHSWEFLSLNTGRDGSLSQTPYVWKNANEHDEEAITAGSVWVSVSVSVCLFIDDFKI